MTFMMKFRRVLLCCRTEEKQHSLEIGSPTDVRRMDVSEGMPGLSEDDRKYIREKASNDAIRLLSLQSHPPTQPPSPSSQPLPSSIASSREPSQTLLNAASANLPPNIPTPPHRQHDDTSPPTSRVKSMWDRTRRLSSSLGSHHSGYHELDIGTKSEDEGVALLNLDLDFKDHASVNLDSPISTSASGKSVEGFEIQDTVGGTPTKKGDGIAKIPAIANAIKDADVGDSSDSDADAAQNGEKKPLVKGQMMIWK